MRRAGLALAVCVAWPLATPAPAFASGFAAAEFGGEHGNVVTTNPTALYFNPGGIAFGKGTRLYVSGVLALRRASWTHTQAASELPEPPGAEGADTGQARSPTCSAAPALAATTWLGRLALGGAFYVPFGGRVHWDPNPRFANDPTFPLAADGVQRWHIIEGAVTSLYFTVGAALRFGPVALGATGNLVRSSVSIRQAKSFNPQQVVDPLNEGRIGIDVAGMHASFGVGAMIEAVRERLWFGASYQAQPGLGPITLDGTLSTSMGTAVAAPRPVTYTHALPDILRAGLRARTRIRGGGARSSCACSATSPAGAACRRNACPSRASRAPSSRTERTRPRARPRSRTSAADGRTPTARTWARASGCPMPSRCSRAPASRPPPAPDETLDPMMPDARTSASPWEAASPSRVDFTSRPG